MDNASRGATNHRINCQRWRLSSLISADELWSAAASTADVYRCRSTVSREFYYYKKRMSESTNTSRQPIANWLWLPSESTRRVIRGLSVTQQNLDNARRNLLNIQATAKSSYPRMSLTNANFRILVLMEIPSPMRLNMKIDRQNHMLAELQVEYLQEGIFH